MPKITIKDKEFQVSDAVSIAILAERTDFNREIKALKDIATAKDTKFKTAKDSLLLTDTLAKIKEIDSDFKTDETNPYKVMSAVVGLEDGKDDTYVKAYFDSYITAKVEAENKKIKDKINKKDESLSIPDTYYDGDK